MTDINPSDLGPWVKLAGDAVTALKAALPLLPKGKDRDEAERKIAEAERTLKLAEAGAARDLGYQLCKEHFPPEPMLETGVPGQVRCRACGRVRGGAAVPVKRKLSAEQEEALVIIADSGGDGIGLGYLAARLRIHDVAARGLVRPLIEAEFVTERSLDFALVMLPDGDEYLVKRGLL